MVLYDFKGPLRWVLVQMDSQRFNEKNSGDGISCMILIHCTTANSTHMKSMVF